MARNPGAGRKRRPPTPRTAKRLQTLYERKLRADDNARAAHDALLLALLDAAELEGASRRELAAVLGVGTTTVQTWLKHAKHLRPS